MAALISLAYVLVAIPLFALSQRACTGLRCRLLALVSVVLVLAWLYRPRPIGQRRPRIRCKSLPLAAKAAEPAKTGLLRRKRQDFPGLSARCAVWSSHAPSPV